MFRKPVSSLSKVKILLIHILNTEPFSSVGSSLYKLAAYCVLNLVKSPGVEVWIRNSYLAKNLVYGQSDIDFTLFINDIDQANDEGKFLKKFSYAKKLFPFLGEVNIYKASQLNFIKPLINPLEARRDPILVEKLSLTSAPTTADKFTYLFRMFLSDLKNLEYNQGSRVRKWNHHFKALDLKSIDVGQSLIERILNELGLYSEYSIKNDIAEMLKLPFVINNKLLDSKLIIYAPQLWHKYFRGPAYFHETLNTLNEASFKEQEFFFAQLRWELFGLMTQLPTIEDKFFQYHYHLPFLIEVLEHLKCSHMHEPLRSNLLNGLIEVRRLLANDFSQFSKPADRVNFELQATAP